MRADDDIAGNGFNARALLWRYAFALILILTFVGGSHLVSLSLVDRMTESNRIISQSINQKTLVERIMLSAETYRELRTTAAKDIIAQQIDQLERVHRQLAAFAHQDPAVEKLYFKGGRTPALDPIMRKFIADAREVVSSASTEAHSEAALLRLRMIGSKILPRSLAEANEGHQLQAGSYSGELGFLQTATFSLAIAVLLFEAIFIFLPAHRTVMRSVRALSAQTEHLKIANEAVRGQNEELDRLRRAAERDALHDYLTGLANRRGFEIELSRLSAEKRRPDAGLAILHIDLDRFKEINDTLGHAAGDRVLQHVGATLRSATNPLDFVARVGGDEFIILRETNGARQGLEALASDIVEKLGRPVDIDGVSCRFGASVGIEIGIAHETDLPVDASRLIANADMALYRAKENGRGQFEFYSDSLRQEFQEAKELSDDMHAGLERGEFIPYYQPQFDAKTGALSGVEALARWRHPTRGVLAPGAFLPLAEKVQLTSRIDRAIQEQALRDIAHWDSLGLEMPSLSLNVSFARLRDPDLLSFFAGHPDVRGRVHLEVLETIFADHIDDELRHVLDQLNDYGVQLEIDDFGTGHASLLSLFSLSPSRLKIARELIAPLPDSEDHQMLVRSICDMAKSLRLGVTAEGVETAAQRDLLEKMGCDRFQGFFFGKPMEQEQISRLLAKAAA